MTATIPDIDELASIVFGDQPACDIRWYDSVIPCGQPAVWLYLLGCGCCRYVCDPCRRDIEVENRRDIADGAIAWECSRCRGVYGLQAVRWVRL